MSAVASPNIIFGNFVTVANYGQKLSHQSVTDPSLVFSFPFLVSHWLSLFKPNSLYSSNSPDWSDSPDSPDSQQHWQQPLNFVICHSSLFVKQKMQMIIWMDQPLANDHLDGLASCKWSSGGTGLLQMIIRMDRPLANDHLDGQASCKWSSG